MKDLFVSDAGEFGVYVTDLARRLDLCIMDLWEPNVVPGWTAYAQSDPPAAPFGQDVYEVAPVGGEQQWGLRPSTQPIQDLRMHPPA